VGDKKLYTRAEFENLRIESASEMAKDQELCQEALSVLVRADHYRWIHQTNWLGEPCLNLPQDMFALQEIIFKTRPKFIVELGVAWGGSLLFYSTLMEVLGGEQIIGVDIYLPEDLKERLASHGRLSERLILIKGSSIEQDTLGRVKAIVGNCREVMIVLDSYHTHDHVLKELHLYSPLVGKGSYLICGDTVVEDIPEQEHRSRPWGPGNNPKTALRQFLKENDRFEVDNYYDQKLLLTCSPGGYLKAVKE
jgi:cephalosporin hydroxylase